MTIKFLNLQQKFCQTLVASTMLTMSAANAELAAYPQSTYVTGITFKTSTVKRLAPGSDNWAMSWGADDHQYTTWGDGGGFNGNNNDGRVSLGFGRVEGTKDNYVGVNIWGGKNAVSPAKFEGKSLGVLDIAGTLYAWRNGAGSGTGAFDESTLYISTDKFVTLSSTDVIFNSSDFPNTKGFFSPTFLQFGKGYTGSRDEYVYVYANENQNDIWDAQKPGKISLFRVLKTEIDQKSKYQFFNGLDSNNNPKWTSNISERKPVFEDSANGIMRTSASYNAGLKRYFLTTQQVSRYQSGNGHIGVYEAPEPWGPWSTVLFENAWSTGIQINGKKSVFWNFSNKWMSADGKDFVIVYTDNDEWATMEGYFDVGEINSQIPVPTTPTGVSVSKSIK